MNWPESGRVKAKSRAVRVDLNIVAVLVWTKCARGRDGKSRQDKRRVYLLFTPPTWAWKLQNHGKENIPTVHMWAGRCVKCTEHLVHWDRGSSINSPPKAQSRVAKPPWYLWTLWSRPTVNKTQGEGARALRYCLPERTAERTFYCWSVGRRCPYMAPRTGAWGWCPPGTFNSYYRSAFCRGRTLPTGMCSCRPAACAESRKGPGPRGRASARTVKKYLHGPGETFLSQNLEVSPGKWAPNL